MRCVRKHISCQKFNQLLWRFIKTGHIERNLFWATSGGVTQSGLISPLLSNIMLNEFDQYLDKCYLGNKA
jgi:RNA-directed DNA polymerase